MLTHKHIAQIVAVLGATIQSVSVFITCISTGTSRISFAVLLALVSFALLYMVNYYLLRNYIKRKIKPIYKVIQTGTTSAYRKLNKDIFDDSNIISDMTGEVAEWLSNKAREVDDLKKLELYRKEYVGNVSHELKTPIFNIQGYVETLLDGGLEDPEINRKYLERASKAINRMISIVKDLETISGLESGNLELYVENFDIVAMCGEVVEAQEILASSKSIKLLVKPAQKPHIFVKADRKLLGQVVTNLVVNSITYGKEQGTTKIAFYDMESSILVEVKDNGIGIATSDQKRIFERFFRVDKSRSRDSGGTGLGLSIVKHVLEAHGQTINVNSELGKGTSFTFTVEKSENQS